MKETDDEFPSLKLTNKKIEPVALEMTATPSDATGIENNKATFVASYRLYIERKEILNNGRIITKT